MGEIASKQVWVVQFYRQEPIGNYILDFHLQAKKVVEVDGSQHMGERAARDLQRNAFLASQGLRVLRLDDLQWYRRSKERRK